MKKKVLASIMATLVATTALFGCGSSSGDAGKSETSSLQEKADGEDQKASERAIAYNYLGAGTCKDGGTGAGRRFGRL